MIELDELWHFLQKKEQAVDLVGFVGSGQRLVDWECGDRDAATLNRLLERLKPWSVKLYCKTIMGLTTSSCRFGGIYRQG